MSRLSEMSSHPITPKIARTEEVGTIARMPNRQTEIRKSRRRRHEGGAKLLMRTRIVVERREQTPRSVRSAAVRSVEDAAAAPASDLLDTNPSHDAIDGIGFWKSWPPLARVRRAPDRQRGTNSSARYGESPESGAAWRAKVAMVRLTCRKPVTFVTTSALSRSRR